MKNKETWFLFYLVYFLRYRCIYNNEQDKEEEEEEKKKETSR
jgi:hypothetical protein